MRDRIEALRRQYPMWGKATLTPLLREEGFAVSESTVGRILQHLMARRVVMPAPALRRRRQASRRIRRFHAQRLRRRPQAQTPGDLLQIDTMQVSLLPGVRITHFTAYCAVSRWTVSAVYRRASSGRAKDFLDRVLAQCPFPVRALQVDGGSEFMKDFEAHCQQLGLPLYVLPPRSPKLNGGVERTNQTWRYEFYNVYPLPTSVAELQPLLQDFQDLYNHYRPHQALNHMAPARYLRLHHPGDAPPLSHMS